MNLRRERIAKTKRGGEIAFSWEFKVTWKSNWVYEESSKTYCEKAI